jgi:hypothetical protein
MRKLALAIATCGMLLDSTPQLCSILWWGSEEAGPAGPP